MIKRVWGIVNSTEVEFTPIRDRPGYWEGLAPKSSGLEERIEIWAEAESGARGHLKCTVQIKYGKTHARLILLPFVAQFVNRYKEDVLHDRFNTEYARCRKVVACYVQ